jgi:hypothetical protein
MVLRLNCGQPHPELGSLARIPTVSICGRKDAQKGIG